MAVKRSDIQIGDFIIGIYGPTEPQIVIGYCSCGCGGVVVEGDSPYLISEIATVLPVRNIVLPDIEWV